jgi:putative membrane-bound dehydrogenase-like protein
MPSISKTLQNMSVGYYHKPSLDQSSLIRIFAKAKRTRFCGAIRQRQRVHAMKRKLLLVSVLAFFATQLFAQSDKPLSPAEALASFQCEPGLRIELVAAEPLVVDPVAMTFDEAGRLFIVENRGYPLGPGPGKLPAGIVALLEDTDGDGRFDKRTVYADGLTFPNGIMCWRGGVIVTCAPDIVYLKDSDGDGKADVRTVVLTGFDDRNTTQLRVSHPTLGPDNWIYVTSGLTGGSIHQSGNTNSIAVKTDLRFRPDTWEFEAADGKGQFGMSFDDAGHRFICMNRVHVQHVVLPSKALRRNPLYPFSETVQNVPETMVPEPLPGHGSAARIYPISHNVTTADSHAGTFTAACGVMIYRGTALPNDFYGNAFACDPTGNLVHRDRLSPVGATFAAARVVPDKEVVASTDDWFRPVFLSQGPDGALYICDMYRKTIEHPTYLPEAVRQHTDFESGKDKGRIYRVTRTNSVRAMRINFATASTQELCGLLNHPNGWHRDTAHRLLLERGDPAAANLLKKFFASSARSLAAGRVFALYLLNQMSALDEGTLVRALSDRDGMVRENALVLVERSQTSSRVTEQILRLATDPESHVRFQCAVALADLKTAAATKGLANIASHAPLDRWTRAAILNAATGNELDLAREFAGIVQRESRPPDEGAIGLLAEIGRIVGVSHDNVQPAFALFLDPASRPASYNLAALDGLIAGLQTRGKPIPQGRIARMEEEARRVSADKSTLLELRKAAADLIGRLDLPGNRRLLLSLTDGAQPVALQIAAIRGLLYHLNATNSAELLNRRAWDHYTPAVREALIDTMVSDASKAILLLDAVADGALPVQAVTSVRRKQLQSSQNEAVRRLALAAFKDVGSADRMKVFEEYKSVLTLKAAPQNGHEIFRKSCSVCHRLDREGVPVGPDLFSMRNQSKETILLHIIVPEYEIMPGFANYLVETKTGQQFSGIIAAETPDAITLRGALNQEQRIPRNDIASINASGLSLMPQELEKTMSRQDLADLLAYLKGEQ